MNTSVDYLNTRVQFGQVVGAFQALKHMAADVLIEVESAKSAAYYRWKQPPRITTNSRPPPH
ncbi:alkylation response protein AidB-like acyl-CoA dehydrogenase [Nocardia kruczakiae]|uniref:Alkylation response protein AidB-like acyl-CoA dehydrogenase n=1 Tax=Nocardia kruczakiae TaxID=261477 RepID=A0ABU1X9Z4_9NOCA|nr:acyl-CoA dehydrogenase family protein [Nocardia kruczakiae]MDR7167365.1 alkylation response protein AidB-like acyl-CoA dehydrogenase [Nocardia kruczakiae]